MFQVTFSEPCFLIKTTKKVVNGKTVGLIFWCLWCWKRPEICLRHLSGNPDEFIES